MSDTRARVTPNKTVALEQLDAELGGPGLSRNDETGEIVAPEPVTQKQLDDAVASHTATFPPDPVAEFHEAVKAATDVEGLKAAILGGNGSPGAEPRRPDQAAV